MRLNRKIRLVVCLGAIATSGFLTNQALACGEQAWADSDETDIGGAKLARMAALDAPLVLSTNPEPENRTGIDPLRGIWIAPADTTIVGVASFYESRKRPLPGNPIIRKPSPPQRN